MEKNWIFRISENVTLTVTAYSKREAIQRVNKILKEVNISVG